MKFRIWDENLNKYIDDMEWFINNDGNVYYRDIMDGELVRAKQCIIHWIPEILENNN